MDFDIETRVAIPIDFVDSFLLKDFIFNILII